MAGRTDPDLKKQLKDSGHWSTFLYRRDQLKAKGVSPKNARSQALSEFLPKCQKYLESRPAPLPNYWTCLVNDLSGSPETVKWLLACLEGRFSPPPNSGARILLQRCRKDKVFLWKFLDMALARLGQDCPELADRIIKADR